MNTQQTSKHLSSTKILDFYHPDIAALVAARGWNTGDDYDRVGAIYSFVRDEIRFGYNVDDSLPASQVLVDGYGQCNTKGNLLMALLRAAGIPCRIHGFTIDQALQAGAIPSALMPLAPARILHSWVEVWLQDSWIVLEGFILDSEYLGQVQQRFADQPGPFTGYGAAVDNIANPPVSWCGQNTYIQHRGIAEDLGIFDDPDTLYREHGSNLRGLKKWLYRYVLRHWINRNVDRIRRCGIG